MSLIKKIILLLLISCLFACATHKHSDASRACPYKELKGKCEAGCEKSCGKLENLKSKRKCSKENCSKKSCSECKSCSSCSSSGCSCGK